MTALVTLRIFTYYFRPIPDFNCNVYLITIEMIKFLIKIKLGYYFVIEMAYDISKTNGFDKKLYTQYFL